MVMPRKLVSLPGLSVPNCETADHVDIRRKRRRLTGIEQFGSGRIGQIDPVEGCRHLLLGQVAGVVVADHVVQAIAALDGRAAVVSAVGVSVGEADVAIFIHFGHRAVVGGGNHRIALEGGDDRIGGIADARRIGSRYVQQVRRGGRNRRCLRNLRRPVPHEGDGPPINRAVQGQLRFRAEAGHHLIGGDGKSSQQPAIGRDVVQKDGRSDAETAVGVGVVPDVVAYRTGSDIRRCRSQCRMGPQRQSVPPVVVGTSTVSPVEPPWHPRGRVSPMVTVEAFPS